MRTFRLERGFWNPAFWLVVAGCVFSVGVVFAQLGPGPDPKYVEKFLGFWEGVDPLDGSPVRMSLSDIDDDRVLELTQQEDFWTFCFNLGPTYSQGRGVVTGTAIVASKDVLNTVTELICIDDNNVSTSQGVAPVQYTLRSRDRVLVLPPFDDAPAIVLHRVAR